MSTSNAHAGEMEGHKEGGGVSVDGVRRETRAVVTRTFGGAEADATLAKERPVEEVLHVETFVTQPAVVAVSFGMTINLGNYETARVDVRLEVPCYREQVDTTYERVQQWVERRIVKEVNDIRAMTRNKVY